MSGSGSKSSSSSNNEDKPNIQVGDDGRVQLGEHDHASDGDEGSIIAAPKNDYPIDAEQDPKISHTPSPKDEGKGQSKCCVLV